MRTNNKYDDSTWSSRPPPSLSLTNEVGLFGSAIAKSLQVVGGSEWKVLESCFITHHQDQRGMDTLPTDDEHQLAPPTRGQAPRPFAGRVLPSSPTEMPVPTAVPSPTSPVHTEEEEETAPLPVPRRRAVAPSSPTEMHIFPGSVVHPTSPIPSDQEERIAPAQPRPRQEIVF